MNWLILILAAFFEIGWPVGFKMSSLHPEKFGLYIALGSLSMLLSGVLFYFAQKTIPIGTAYIVWTGLGAIGTFVIGIWLFGDTFSALKMFFALLILVGIMGMEVCSR